MIMEKTIQLVAALPSGSKRQEMLTNVFIDELWYSLDHPPLLYMGDQFRFRQADGSNNVSFYPFQIQASVNGNSLKSHRIPSCLNLVQLVPLTRAQFGLESYHWGRYPTRKLSSSP
jgi:hypothetical protein